MTCRPNTPRKATAVHVSVFHSGCSPALSACCSSARCSAAAAAAIWLAASAVTRRAGPEALAALVCASTVPRLQTTKTSLPLEMASGLTGGPGGGCAAGA
jgi:hypothetical protein